MDDEHFMQEALKNAFDAFSANEVPVGAVLVYQGKIIAQGFNQVEAACVATRHAEMQCLERGAEALGGWRLSECVLYTTLEPCLMCFGAAILSRVKKIVFGANDLRHGACGGCFDLTQTTHPIHNVEVVGGVLRQECGQILKDFFKKVRSEKADDRNS